MSNFKVAVCQVKVTDNKTENLINAHQHIQEAASKGATLVVLPEMFNCPYDNKFFPQFAEPLPGGPTSEMLSTAAKKHSIYIVGGSMPERDGDNIYNTSPLFGPNGHLLAKHRKVHLFDVKLASGISFQESLTLSPGNHVTVVKTQLCPVGVAICYDMRFPEIFRLMALGGAEVIVVPGAFNLTTGPAHWHLSLRMRSVDNQVYTVGASPARFDTGGYIAYGHSLVVDPWGEVLADAGTGENIIYAQIDLDRVKQIRQQLPLLKHRRTDIY